MLSTKGITSIGLSKDMHGFSVAYIILVNKSNYINTVLNAEAANKNKLKIFISTLKYVFLFNLCSIFPMRYIHEKLSGIMTYIFYQSILRPQSNIKIPNLLSNLEYSNKLVNKTRI